MFNSSKYILLFSLFVCLACQEKTKKIEEGKILPQTGNIEIDKLTDALRENPTDPSLFADRAMLLYEMGSYDNAIVDFQRAITLDSTNIDYYHSLSNVYLDYFRSRSALQTLEKALEISDNAIPTLLKYAEMQLILTKHNESLKTVDKILKQEAQNADAFLLMGLNFKEMGDTSKAIASFQESVDNNSGMVDAWIELGQLLGATGKQEAVRCFDNAIQVAPRNVDAYHAKADYLANTIDDLEGAIEVYEQLNLIDPQYEDAYYNSGLIYLDLNELEKAHKQFDIAIKISPTHIRAYYYRGVASELQGNYQVARTDYQQALNMASNYEAAQEGLERLQQYLTNEK